MATNSRQAFRVYSQPNFFPPREREAKKKKSCGQRRAFEEPRKDAQAPRGQGLLQVLHLFAHVPRRVGLSCRELCQPSHALSARSSRGSEHLLLGAAGPQSFSFSAMSSINRLTYLCLSYFYSYKTSSVHKFYFLFLIPL